MTCDTDCCQSYVLTSRHPSVEVLLYVGADCGRRGSSLSEPDESVCEGPADDHEDTEPPERRFDVGVVDDGDERLGDGLGVRADVVRDGGRDVDLHGADPANEEAEETGADQQRDERAAREQAQRDDVLRLACAEDDWRQQDEGVGVVVERQTHRVFVDDSQRLLREDAAQRYEYTRREAE